MRKKSVKTTLKTVGTIVLLLSVLFPMNVQSIQEQETSSFSITYSFSQPVIETQSLQDQTYSVINLPMVQNSANPGEPFLPVESGYILLPPQVTVESIQVQVKNTELFTIDHLIEPMGSIQPISKPISEAKPLIKDEQIYSSNDFFPSNRYQQVGVYSSHGYRILVLELYPIRYQPSSNTLSFSNELIVTVETTSSDQDHQLYRSNDKDKQFISNKVDNPKFISLYNSEISRADSSAYELLIITDETLESPFSELKEFHDTQGIQTMIRTLDDIGSDSPADIRAYIKQMYLSEGISYVLLGGDDDVIPAQHLYVSGLDEGTEFYETVLPSDLFYACLDGSFNDDGDDLWGERTDGEGGTDVDLMAEVYVGRATVSNVEEADLFVDKTIQFITQYDTVAEKRAVYVGEHLGDYGIASHGGNYLDQFIDGSTDDGYETVGIPTEEYTPVELYDRDGRWSPQELMDYADLGVVMINHLGHSNYYYNMKMRTSDVATFENDQLFFVYSQGCMAGGFDNKDCIAEYMTVKQPFGAVAGIWNARYGWFWAYRTDGDSQRFHREFWDAIFGEQLPTIGMANHDSKEDNLYLINRSCMRWVYYETNLFGDPTLAFYSYRPETPDKPDGPDKGTIEEYYQYQTSTSDPNNDLVYYQWDIGSGEPLDWMGPFAPGDVCVVNYTWNEKGTYSVRVRAKDEHGYHSAWSDPLEVSMPYTKQDQKPFLKMIMQEWMQRIQQIFSFS